MYKVLFAEGNFSANIVRFGNEKFGVKVGFWIFAQFLDNNPNASLKWHTFDADCYFDSQDDVRNAISEYNRKMNERQFLNSYEIIE